MQKKTADWLAALLIGIVIWVGCILAGAFAGAIMEWWMPGAPLSTACVMMGTLAAVVLTAWWAVT